MSAQVLAPKQVRRVQAAPSAVSEARRWVTGIAEELLEGRQRDSLRLVISEVVTNALLYGAPGEHIDLAVTPKPQFLCVQVTDDGPGLVPRPSALGSGDDVGGFGLYFVEQLTRRWGVTRENRRTRVWFELDYAG